MILRALAMFLSVAAAAMALMIIVGCDSLRSVAPPISSEMIAAVGGNSEALTAGRRVLTVRCTACHSLEPIAKFSAKEWREIVDKMAERANLDAREREQVRSYLVTARESVP